MAGIRQFDEQAAFDAALRLFWSQGLAATSMLDLARATSVQRGSLYHAYGDKEALFLRVFALYAGRFLGGVEEALQAPEPEAMLAGFFRAAIGNMTSGEPPRGCLTTKTAMDGGAASEKIRARLQALMDDLRALLEAAFSRPEIRRRLAVEPAEAALIVASFTRGLAVMERIHGDKVLLERAAEAFSRSLLREA